MAQDIPDNTQQPSERSSGENAGSTTRNLTSIVLKRTGQQVGVRQQCHRVSGSILCGRAGKLSDEVCRTCGAEPWGGYYFTEQEKSWFILKRVGIVLIVVIIIFIIIFIALFVFALLNGISLQDLTNQSAILSF